MKRYKYLAKFYFTTQFHFQEFEFHSVGVWGFVSNTRYKKAQTISELSGVSYVLPFSLLVGVQELRLADTFSTSPPLANAATSTSASSV